MAIMGCYKHSSDRLPPHHAHNDIIRRALIFANDTCTLDPRDLSRSNAGSWSNNTKTFIMDLARRLRDKRDDPHSESYLFQTLWVAIQRRNAASVIGTFGPDQTREDISVT
ncbi:hypothetical protein EVAR_26569_1 [Eumeta japonica]|uniref:Uncharacterized protein n=1 Tax=Eumeta variegata TaxID=151549 RepID=A0A4C1W7G8_EUMVA|nr:hypothetical protein EVAR_26569_1 [Eumeta japonica]